MRPSLFSKVLIATVAMWICAYLVGTQKAPEWAFFPIIITTGVIMACCIVSAMIVFIKGPHIS